MSGKSHMQDDKNKKKWVTFEEDIGEQLEHCHTLIMQVHPNPREDVKCAMLHVMLTARVVDNIDDKVTAQGASFMQQCVLQKGLKIFGKRGNEASSKEMDQLHRQSCFVPMSVASMTPAERKKAMEALMFLMEK